MFQFQREAARALGLISQVSRWYSAAVVSEHAAATHPTEKQHHPEWLLQGGSGQSLIARMPCTDSLCHFQHPQCIAGNLTSVLHK